MSVVVIFGAGASAFCGPTIYNAASGSMQSCPPVGNGPDGLFARLRLVSGYCSAFPTRLADSFVEDFERGMSMIQRGPTSLLVGMQREIALHLARYEIESGNYYSELLKSLDAHVNQVCWCTLNYDLLLEQAIRKCGFRVDHEPRGALSTGAQVLKPHGSSSFLPKLGSNVFQGNYSSDIEPGVIAIGGNFNIEFAEDSDQIREWCAQAKHDEFAPVLAQYARGKPFMSSLSQMNSIQREVSRQILAATHVFVIGVRFTPLDTHLWNPLRQSRATISVVNPVVDDLLWWGKGRSAVTQHIADSFEHVALIADAIKRANANP